LAGTGLAAALFAGCSTVAPPVATSWNTPPIGSTWQNTQRNTGSYGKDAEIEVTRGEGTWEGNKVVTMTRTESGVSIMALPSGKWMAIVGKDGKPLITYDPPIGYEYPLQVGKTWKTRHRATNTMTGRVVEFDYSCIVEGVERVTVRAGTFDAFKIVCENELSRDVTWASHEVGLNVKMDYRRKPANPSGEGTQQAELAAFKLAK
jgi:hypothetical protein